MVREEAASVVRLPVVLSAIAETPAPEEVNAPCGASFRILVVDDNVDAATSAAMLLEMMGHETEMVHDGLAAFEAAASYRPDIVLLDIGLPGLTGYEVASRIREQPWGRSMTLWALTGWGQDEDRRKSKEAGFDHHMVKPVDPPELVRLLGDLVLEGP